MAQAQSPKKGPDLEQPKELTQVGETEAMRKYLQETLPANKELIALAQKGPFGIDLDVPPAVKNDSAWEAAGLASKKDLLRRGEAGRLPTFSYSGPLDFWLEVTKSDGGIKVQPKYYFEGGASLDGS